MEDGRDPRARATLARRAAVPGALTALAAVLVALTATSAVFSSSTANGTSTLTAATLNTWLPTAVTATRVTSTSCQVDWTAAASTPSGLTYDVTDGTSTVTTSVSGTSSTVTVPPTTVTPTVKARVGAWISASATAAAPACSGFPDAPGGLALTPGDGQVTASWTAPAGNGGTVSGYTVTTTPGGGICTTTAPTTTCSVSGLTDGVTYTLSVTATSAVGTGPAATASAIPYPSSVMTGATTKLWLDAADTSTLFASSTCTGSTVSTAGQSVGCWKDKSANATAVSQSTGTMTPTLTTSGGRPVPGFDGVNDTLTFNASGLPTGTSDSTLFAVGTLTSAAVPYSTLLSYGTAANGQMRQLMQDSTSATVRLDTHGSGVSAVSGTWSPTAPTVVASTFSGGTTLSLWPRGAAATTSTGSYSTTGTQAAIGSKSVGTEPWTGPIHEVILLNAGVTATQRRAVEEYLARKWSTTITPQSPTGASATVTGSTAAVSWTAPAWDGGASVTGYTAYATPSGGGSTITCTAVAPATTCTLSGLNASGTTYVLQVSATNSVGAGPASSTTSFTTSAPYAANLKVWLAADDLDGDNTNEAAAESGTVSGAVQTWKDKSGNGNDVSAPTTGERPSYAAQTLNGNRVLTFNGSTVLQGAAAADPFGITGDRSLFVVTRPRAWTSGTPTGSDGTTVLDRFYSTASNPVFSLKACSSTWCLRQRNDAGTAVSVLGSIAPSAGRADLLAAWRTGTTDALSVAGAPETTATNSGTATQQVPSVGRHYNTTDANTDQDVAEVLLYNRALSAAEARTVETYLYGKWGVGLVPAAPTAAAATRGNTTLAVSWTAPTDVGSSAVASYTATASPGGNTCAATVPTTTCTLTGLTNGTAYTVTVTATNTAGTSAASSPSAAVTPDITPNAPTGPSASAGDTTATFSWTAPSSNGGTAITGYTATAVPTDGSLATVTCTSTPPTTTCSPTAGTMTNGGVYSVTVTATNAAGVGTVSSAVTAIPFPALLTSANSQLWLDGADGTKLYSDAACTTVAGTGAGSVIGCWKDKSGQARNATMISSGNATVGSTTLNTLRPLTFSTASSLGFSRPASGDMTLLAVVRTSQSRGTSNWYNGAAVMDGDVSGSLTNDYGFSLVAGKPAYGTGNADVTATGPVAVNTGSAAVIVGRRSGTSLEASAHDATRGTATSGNSGALTSTTTVYIGRNQYVGDIAELLAFDRALTVAEQSSLAQYLARKWGATVAPPAPTGTTGVAGNGSATISWTAPAWDGGSAVTGYTVTSSPGGSTCTATAPATSCTVTGLTNGTAYTVTVTATNSVGTGPASSASAAVTPATVPGAPTAVNATVADTTSSVSWTAPGSTGGSAITAYTATAVPGSGGLSNVTCSSASSPCTLTGLTNGVTYTVSVTATNAMGTGAASTSTTVVPIPTVMASANLKVWLDAQSAASLNSASGCSGSNVSTGSSVLCWKDRTSNGWNAVRGSTSAVLTANAINGKQALRFVKTHPDYYDVTAVGIGAVGSADRTMFAVTAARTTYGTTNTNSAAVVAAWTGWTSGILGHANSGSTTTIDMLQSDGYNSGTSGIYGGMTATDPAIAAGVFSSSGGVLTNAFALNGSGPTSSQSVSGTWYSYGNLFRVGSAGTTATNAYDYPLDGDIGEVLVFNKALTATERRSVEEYLAWRWAQTITPSAPATASATAGASTATVTFTAPAWNGGAAVTGYAVAPTAGAGTCTWTSGLTASCTGLTHLASYTFTVSAVNSAGTGPVTTTNSVTP